MSGKVSFKKTFFKNIYKLHVYIGIFIALHFAIFALTGLILLFKDEFKTTGGESSAPAAESQVLSRQQIAVNYEKIFNSLKQSYPQDRLLAIFPEDEHPEQLQARLGIDGATQLRGARRTLFDLNSGEEIKSKPSVQEDFFDWTLKLHRELFLGSNGKLYLGVVGLLYVFMLISGLFIYGNFMKTRGFGEIRKQKIKSFVDLHKFVGVVTFGWSFVVGLSGVFLAFNGVLIKLFQIVSLKHLSEQYQSFKNSAEVVTAAPFHEVIQTALQAKPDSVITYISFPDTEFGIPGHFLMLMNGTTALTERISELVVVNAASAKLAEIVELPLYLKIVLLSEPLHFGDYGGVLLKIIWILFTIASLAVAVFGVSSFFMKRNMRKSSVVSSEKAVFRENVSVDTEAVPYVKVMNSSIHIYNKPFWLSLLSFITLVIALFVKGFVAQIAILLLFIPLLVLIFGRKKND